MSAKKLFTVRKITQKHSHIPETFASKPEAKAKRDELNGAKFVACASPEYVVARAEDHRHGPSNSIPNTRPGSVGGKKKAK